MEVKFTREDGTDCHRGTIMHEVGKVITAPDWEPTSECGKGLHFGEAGLGIKLVSGRPGKVGIPGKAFEVEAIGQVVEISPGQKKAQRLKILKELNFSKLLSELAQNKDWLVRATVAENPNTSRKTLSELAKDKHYFVKGRVARNPNTSQKSLSELVRNSELTKDEDWLLRGSIARHPNTSRKTLLELAKDENVFVRQTALAILN